MNSESTVNERIKILLDTRAKGNKAAFARLAGVSGQAIGDIVEGRKGNPSFSVLQSLIKAFPDVSAEWLIAGIGPMQKGQQPDAGAGLTSGEATVVESETLLKLAVTEAQLEAARQENARLYDLLGKSPSSPDAAGRWFAPLAPFGQRAVAAYAR